MNTTKFGRQGESLAAESYQKKVYTILKWNYRFSSSEVEIIARKVEVVAIVEFKSRSSTYFVEPQSFI